MQRTKVFYDRLLEALAQQEWPSDYLFKFIVLNNHPSMAQVQKEFDNLGAAFHYRDSKNKKYISISIKVKMENAEAVVIKYKSLEKIKDIISL